MTFDLSTSKPLAIRYEVEILQKLDYSQSAQFSVSFPGSPNYFPDADFLVAADAFANDVLTTITAAFPSGQGYTAALYRKFGAITDTERVAVP